jgi:hypothetical protein
MLNLKIKDLGSSSNSAFNSYIMLVEIYFLSLSVFFCLAPLKCVCNTLDRYSQMLSRRHGGEKDTLVLTLL